MLSSEQVWQEAKCISCQLLYCTYFVICFRVSTTAKRTKCSHPFQSLWKEQRWQGFVSQVDSFFANLYSFVLQIDILFSLAAHSANQRRLYDIHYIEDFVVHLHLFVLRNFMVINKLKNASLLYFIFNLYSTVPEKKKLLHELFTFWYFFLPLWHTQLHYSR